MSQGSDSLAKHLAIALAIAVVFYVAGFTWIEHRRVVKGPWQVTFLSDAAGQPAISIAQPMLNISEKLSFPGEQAGRANLYVAMQFRQPMTHLPFGEMIFQDALFLPGTVAMRLFGHQVELLPRTLVIDNVEHPWERGKELSVSRKKSATSPPEGQRVTRSRVVNRQSYILNILNSPLLSCLRYDFVRGPEAPPDELQRRMR